jgi:hypothetical protein
MENCPEEPVRSKYGIGVFENQRFSKDHDDYQQALQSIPAIEIINPELLPLADPIHRYSEENTLGIKDGDYFPIPDALEYIVLDAQIARILSFGDAHKTMPLRGKVARLYVKAEKGETQEEMWNEVIQIIGTSAYIHAGNSHYDDLIKDLSQYTITYKPKQ